MCVIVLGVSFRAESAHTDSDAGCGEVLLASSKLLDLLTTLVTRKVAASPRWPKSPERLAIELRRIAPQLRVHGIFVNLGRCNKGRFVQLLPAP